MSRIAWRSVEGWTRTMPQQSHEPLVPSWKTVRLPRREMVALMCQVSAFRSACIVFTKPRPGCRPLHLDWLTLSDIICLVTAAKPWPYLALSGNYE